MDFNKAALEMHETHHGKVGIVSKVEVKTRDDLSTAYTPGVAEPCRKIRENPDDVYKYTFKSNMVAVVSNGTAVLGLGDIGPSQGDYFQAVKGGGHGDHRNLVLAPSTAQECYDMMFRAFALAFKYANPVMLLGDAIVAQIKEPVRRQPPAAPWRMEGYGKRGPGAKPRLLKSVYLAEGALAARNRLLMEKYAAMQAEACAECWNTDDAELVVVAFGSMARIARSAASCAKKASRRACSVPRRSIPSRPTPCAPWLRAAASWLSNRTPARWWKTCACP